VRKRVRDALLAAVLFGLSTPVAKVLAGNVPTQFLAGLLYIGSGAGLAVMRRTNVSYTSKQQHGVSDA